MCSCKAVDCVTVVSVAAVMLFLEMHMIGTAAINNPVIFIIMSVCIYVMYRHSQGYVSPYLCDLYLVYSFA